MRNKTKILLTVGLLAYSFMSYGQSNPVQVASPFLLATPDARSAGMGETGAATSPDAYSNYWNDAKPVFAETPSAVSFTYFPWLPAITNGMGYIGLSGYTQVNYHSAIGFEVKYLSEQSTLYRDSTGIETGLKNPFDISVGGSYSYKLTDQYSIGAGVKYIRAAVVPTGGLNNLNDANALGFDLGFYSEQFIQDKKFSWGIVINNIGNKIGYGGNFSFQPTNLRLGAALNVLAGDNSSFTVAFDANKLLVPSPPDYGLNGNIIKGSDNSGESAIKGLYSSFYDAPGGFSEELQEVQLNMGVEYAYMHQFFLRVGGVYQNPNKGDERYLTAGLGFNYQHIDFDASYVLPLAGQSPYSNTFHLTLSFAIESDVH